jgi:hypothetical protein
MPRKKKVAARKKRSTHNPSLKLTMRRKHTRLVHGYETKSRKRK